MTSPVAATTLAPVLALLPLLLPFPPPVGAPGEPGAVPAPVVRVPDPTAPATGTWPLDPQPAVVTGFDPPTSAYGPGHRGVDLAGRPGQTVRAAAAGRVTFAGRLAGRGVVVVGHGTTRTTYEPVTAGVRVGEAVAVGQAIGALEAVDSHCAPSACLHWGLLEGEVYLDPLSLVGGGPVRLLPLLGGSPARSSP